jgi:TolA-binding protein
MKMLKVFSNQLRQVNDQFASVLRESEAANSDDGLFGISEYFLKHTKYERAHYVLQEYIKEYPEGKNIVNAKKNFEILEKMKKGKNGW